jgi:hypothetical protein
LTTSGNQKIFGNTPINDIDNCIETFKAINQTQEKLKNLVRLGLTIAYSMTKENLLNTDGYNHKDLDTFYSQLTGVTRHLLTHTLTQRQNKLCTTNKNSVCCYAGGRNNNRL